MSKGSVLSLSSYRRRRGHFRGGPRDTVATRSSSYNGWNSGTLNITNTETNVAAATSTGPVSGCRYYPPYDTCERTETACLPCGTYSAQQAGSSGNYEISWFIRDAGGSTVAEASGTDSATFLASGFCASCGLGSGAVSDSECATCPAGKYSDIDGIGTCTSCVAGTYSGTVGATSSAVCLECEAGKSSEEGASTSSSCFTPVCYTVVTRDFAGDGWSGGTLTITNTETYVAAATSTGPEEGCAYAPSYMACERTETACLPCGTYSAQQAGSSYSDEISWFIRDAGGSTVAEATRTYSATFSIACASCGLGSGGVSDSECETCPVGKYSDVDGVGPCTSCFAGTYSGTVGATSSAVCLECEAGKFSDSGASSCTTCGPAIMLLMVLIKGRDVGVRLVERALSQGERDRDPDE